jgi:hypothetical protein
LEEIDEQNLVEIDERLPLKPGHVEQHLEEMAERLPLMTSHVEQNFVEIDERLPLKPVHVEQHLEEIDKRLPLKTGRVEKNLEEVDEDDVWTNVVLWLTDLKSVTFSRKRAPKEKHKTVTRKSKVKRQSISMAISVHGITHHKPSEDVQVAGEVYGSGKYVM